MAQRRTTRSRGNIAASRANHVWRGSWDGIITFLHHKLELLSLRFTNGLKTVDGRTGLIYVCRLLHCCRSKSTGMKHHVAAPAHEYYLRDNADWKETDIVT
jgi:hypothetical protein